MFWNENAEQKFLKIFEGQRQDTGAITVIYTTDIDFLNDLLFELPEEIGSVLLVRHASKTTQKVIDLPRRLDA